MAYPYSFYLDSGRLNMPPIRSLNEYLPFYASYNGASIPHPIASLDLVRQGDIESIMHWRNGQLEILRQTAPLTLQEQYNYWNCTAWPDMKLPAPPNILFSYRFNEALIGYGGLVHIDWERSTAELSTLLAPRLIQLQLFETLSKYYIYLSLLFAQRLDLKLITTQTFDIRLNMIRLIDQIGFEYVSYEPSKKTHANHQLGAWFHQFKLSNDSTPYILKQLQSIDLSALQGLVDTQPL